MQPSFSHEYVNFLSFDTHKCIKELQQNFGFNEKQAEGVVKAIIESKDYDLSKLATKEQLSVIQSDIALVRKEMQTFATREQLLEVENKILQSKITLKEEISKSKNETLKWMISLFITLIIAIFVRPYFH